MLVACFFSAAARAANRGPDGSANARTHLDSGASACTHLDSGANAAFNSTFHANHDKRS
jgi:hypothetical protein